MVVGRQRSQRSKAQEKKTILGPQQKRSANSCGWPDGLNLGLGLASAAERLQWPRGMAKILYVFCETRV